MTIARVTQNLLINRTLINLSKQQRRLFHWQQQLASGQRVNVPSDDPLATRRAVDNRSGIAQNEQYIANIDMAGLHLRDTETSVTTVVEILQRTNELTLQAANQVNGPLQLEQISQEINQLLESLFDEANEISNGRYIFGGTRTMAAPFEAVRDANGDISQVNYVGNSEYITVEINEDIRVRINETGNGVFNQSTPQTVDIFQMMIDARDNMRADDRTSLQTRLEEINSGISQCLVAVSRIGSSQNRLERTSDNLSSANLQLEQVVSSNIDADFAEVTLNLNSQINSYQAALNAGARIIQPSLLDFLG